MDSVSIPNSRGRKIAAVIHYSQGNKRLAILCPGYLDTKDYAHLVDLANKFAERGYTTVRFDPSGTWESEGPISEYLTSQYLDDIKSVLEYMLAKDSYTQVLLGGHSRGGQVSLLYAARDPRITEVVGIMPSHGPVEGSRRTEWEATGVKESDRDIPGSEERRQFAVPFQHVLDRDQFDALGDMPNIHVPVYLFAGELDDLVPPEEVQELFDAANEPKKYLVLKGIDHDYRLNPLQVEEVNNRIIQTIER